MLTVLVTADFTGGTDLESDDSLRNRMLFAFSHPIQTGDLDDYVQWSLQLPQITRAWAVGPQRYGPGTVTVYFMEDADRAPEFGFPKEPTEHRDMSRFCFTRLAIKLSSPIICFPSAPRRL